MDFAPYQDTSPDQRRAFSPSPPPRRDLSRSPPQASNIQRNIASTIQSSGQLPPPSHFGADIENESAEAAQGYGYPASSSNAGGGGGGFMGAGGGGRSHVNLFETSLPMRLDYEAVAAYVCLPPAGAVLLLLVEHKSDFVRFHAWQSSVLFTGIFIVHLIFSFSSVVSWILFTIDLLLIALLSYKAYQDADNLDRFELPFIGPLASNWVDAE